MVELGIAGTAASVNTSGDVVGTWGTSAGLPPRGYVWRNGVRTDLPLDSDAYGNYGTVINESGQIGGFHHFLSASAFGEQQATVWNGVTSPVLIGNRTRWSNVDHLNSAGQATLNGTSSETNLVNLTDMQDLFWSPATGIVALGDLGGGARGAEDINESGTVVGVSPLTPGDDRSGRAFAWTFTGGMRDLGTLGGASSWAQAVNARDEVVGAAATAAEGGGKPVKWVGGVAQQLDTLQGSANDVNNSGHAVGWRLIDGRQHATLWRDGVAIDLGAGPGSEAVRINDLDVILGRSPTGPFVWTNPAEGPVLLPTLGGENRFAGDCTAGNFIAGWSRTAEADAGPQAVRWEVQVTPLSDDGAIVDLQTSVEELEEGGAINTGEANSLDAKLEGALMQCERGNETAARHQIEAFINHTRALVRSGRLAASDGDALIAEAEALLAGLDCSAG
ncbi:MAG TPA: hypothetical protein VIV11_33685 [Kofleriaceae bacterium]